MEIREEFIAAIGDMSLGHLRHASRTAGGSREDRTASAAYRGDGFYVWDRDERVAEAWARELAGDSGRVERVV